MIGDPAVTTRVRRVTPGPDTATPADDAPGSRHRGAGVVTAVATGGAVIAGSFLRFAASSPLWLDEALSVNIATLGPGRLADALRHDGHPALYYLTLGAWIDVAGDGDRAVRALSGMASLLAVVVLGLVARRRFGTRVAVHTVVLTATSPFLVRYGSEARMYALVVLTTAVAWWALESHLATGRRWSLALLALATAAAAHLHYWTFWLIAATVVVAAVAWWRSRGRRPAAVLAALGVGSATVAVWLPVLGDQIAHTGTPWADRARPAEVVVETIEALGAGMRFEPLLVGILLAVAAVLGATVVGAGGGHLVLGTVAPAARPVVAVTVATLALGGTAALVTGGAFEARYTAVVIGPLLVLAARGTAALPGRAGTAALTVLALGGLLVAADEARRDRTQGAEIAAALDAAALPGEPVVFCPDQLGPATVRRLDHGGPFVTYPGGDDPRFVDWYDYRERIAARDPVAFAADVEDRAGADTRIWLVFAPGYRGFEGRCETIVDQLGAHRVRRPVVAPRRVFEPMALFVFEPAP